jgi:hypothetical protein
MLSRLEEHRFLAVVGASGVGNPLWSAPVCCRLSSMAFLRRSHTLAIRYHAPQARHLSTRQAFHDAWEARPYLRMLPLPKPLTSQPAGLIDAIAESAHQAGTHYLLLVDQFEEIFRFRYRKDRIQSTDAGRQCTMSAMTQPPSTSCLQIAKQAGFPCTLSSPCGRFTGTAMPFVMPQAINESQFRPAADTGTTPRCHHCSTQVFQSEAEPEQFLPS